VAKPLRPASFSRRIRLVAGLFAGAIAGCGASNAERPYKDAGPGATDPAAAPRADATPPSPPPNGGGAGASGLPAVDMGAPAHDAGAPAPAPLDMGPAADAGLPDATASCQPEPLPACDGPSPPAPPRRTWRNFGSGIVAVGTPRHRGRDLYLAADSPQWLIGKLGYGPFDANLSGEEVDVFLLRGCGTTWEKLGTANSTRAGDHPDVEGAADNGGRVYFEVPKEKALGPGRHRVRLVVAGDGSAAEFFVEVRPAGTKLAVLDVDGTLTTSEAAEFGALLGGQLPAPQPDAARAVGLLAARGYRLLYLTARPEWLTARTRDFLTSNGFPAGVIETTTGGTGALGADATKFKTEALARVSGKGFVPAFAIGNTDSDAAAYATQIKAAQSRVFFRFTDAAHGGRRIDDYAALARELETHAPVCP
jgi:hypothetical protein